MICEICGKKGAMNRHTTRSYGEGPDLIVIENVPIVRCPNCGELYLPAATLHELERIKMHRGPLSRKRAVAVAKFPKEFGVR